jgi:hypothetical protein
MDECVVGWHDLDILAHFITCDCDGIHAIKLMQKCQ